MLTVSMDEIKKLVEMQLGKRNVTIRTASLKTLGLNQRT
jgi:hypothetical protein